MKINIIFLMLASCIISSSSLCQEYKKVDSLLKVLKTTKVDTNKVLILYQLSDKLSEIKPLNAISLARQGLMLSKKIAFIKGGSICLNALGNSYTQLGVFDTALIYYKERLKLTSIIGDSMGIAGSYDNISVIYVMYSKNDTALKIRMNAINIYKRLGKDIFMADGYNWIGNIYKGTGNYPQALENYMKALKIYEKKHEEKNIGYPLLNISSIFRYYKKYNDAKKYAFDAKGKFINSNNPNGVGMSLYRIALIYSEEKDYNNSNKYLENAKHIFLQTSNIPFLLNTNIQQGNNYCNENNNKKALNCYYQSLALANKVGDRGNVAIITGSIGVIFINQKEYEKSLKYLFESYKIANEVNDSSSIRFLSSYLMECYSYLNKPDSAMKYFKIYQNISEKLFNLQNSNSIADMQVKYDTEKKDQEIILTNEKRKKETLHYAISIISLIGIIILGLLSFFLYQSRKKRQIIEINELRLKDQIELHKKILEVKKEVLNAQLSDHFISNAMSSINHFIEMNDKNKASEYLLKFSRLVSKVLTNSLKKSVPIIDEIEILNDYISLEKLRFKDGSLFFNVEIDSEIDPETTFIPPLILQVFTENSIVHGFTKEIGGAISINVIKKNNTIEYIVKDNGIGRKASIEEKMKENPEKVSLGGNLAEKLIEISSEEKRGYKFEINDLYDNDNNPTGTAVIFTTPIDLAA